MINYLLFFSALFFSTHCLLAQNQSDNEVRLLVVQKRKSPLDPFRFRTNAGVGGSAGSWTTPAILPTTRAEPLEGEMDAFKTNFKFARREDSKKEYVRDIKCKVDTLGRTFDCYAEGSGKINWNEHILNQIIATYLRRNPLKFKPAIENGRKVVGSYTWRAIIVNQK